MLSCKGLSTFIELLGSDSKKGYKQKIIEKQERYPCQDTVLTQAQ